MTGEILSTLERRNGVVLLERLMVPRQCSRDLVVMAPGWLFRKGGDDEACGYGDVFGGVAAAAARHGCHDG